MKNPVLPALPLEYLEPFTYYSLSRTSTHTERKLYDIPLNDDDGQFVSLIRYAYPIRYADSCASRIPLSFLFAFPAFA